MLGTLLKNRANLTSALNEVGLNWNASEWHRPLFSFRGHNQLYFITCPSNLILGLVDIRKYDGDSPVWGKKHIWLSFHAVRQPTEDKFNLLQQEKLLTDGERILF